MPTNWQINANKEANKLNHIENDWNLAGGITNRRTRNGGIQVPSVLFRQATPTENATTDGNSRDGNASINNNINGSESPPRISRFSSRVAVVSPTVEENDAQANKKKPIKIFLARQANNGRL